MQMVQRESFHIHTHVNTEHAVPFHLNWQKENHIDTHTHTKHTIWLPVHFRDIMHPFGTSIDIDGIGIGTRIPFSCCLFFGLKMHSKRKSLFPLHFPSLFISTPTGVCKCVCVCVEWLANVPNVSMLFNS